MKWKYVLLAACIFFIAVLQSTVLDYARVFNVKPNLFILFIISFALIRGNVEGATVGFFTGLTQDIISGKMLGFYALMGLYLGLAAGSLNKRLYRENIIVVIFFSFVSTLAYESVVYLTYEWGIYFFSSLVKNQIDILFALKNIILPEAVYNSVVSVFMHAIVIRLTDRFESAEKPVGKY